MRKNSQNISMMTFLSRCSTTLTITTLFLLVQLLLSPPPISATTQHTPLLDITDTPVSAITALPKAPILDTDGNPLDFTSQYYIIPATPGFLGGLRLKIRSYQGQDPLACPEYVYRTPSENDFGLPVKFIPADPAQTNITLFADVKISFASPYLYCPAVWSLTPDKETDRLYVSTGVHDVNRNCKVKQGTTVDATFKIVPTAETGPYVYSIRYPRPPPVVALGHLELVPEDGTDLLGVSFKFQQYKLPFYFKKSN